MVAYKTVEHGRCRVKIVSEEQAHRACPVRLFATKRTNVISSKPAVHVRILTSNSILIIRKEEEEKWHAYLNALEQLKSRKFMTTQFHRHDVKSRRITLDKNISRLARAMH